LSALSVANALNGEGGSLKLIFFAFVGGGWAILTETQPLKAKAANRKLIRMKNLWC
jgi:hypothetical protein